MADPADPFVSTDWLAERLGAEGMVVVDASWFLPTVGRDGHDEYGRAHIPGAVFFDIEAIADHASPLPHMLPSPMAFAEAASKLGIGDETTVVAYAADGMVPAARAWWMFRVFGHDKVLVLDGGLPKWLAEVHPVDDVRPEPDLHKFTPRFRPELVRDFYEVRHALQFGGQVADARSAERFRGEAPEPRAGLKSGHMPGARCLPSTALVTPDGTFKPKAQLVGTFALHHLDPAAPVTATCGSGISACMIALALARLGNWEAAVYDGSWTDWGARDDAPVAVGA